MKYKLINLKTNEEHLCDKVTIEGFDYYVSDEEIKESDWYLAWETINNIHSNHIVQKATNSEPVGMYSWASNYKKVIATNNPNIDIPKVVDEVEELAHEYFAQERFNWEQENPNGLKSPQPLIEQYNKTFTPLYKAGYNKSQETHPFSEEDMKSFLKFSIEYRRYNDLEGLSKTSEELLQLWKEQRTKILYYE